jgi:hypothetical protein
MKGSTSRGNLRGLWGAVLLALPLGIVHVMGGPAPAAESIVSVCGWARSKVITSTSVSVGTYCVDSQDSRCRPSFPYVTADAFVADAFVCVHWHS